jgi:hypothetical protein
MPRWLAEGGVNILLRCLSQLTAADVAVFARTGVMSYYCSSLIYNLTLLHVDGNAMFDYILKNV